MLVPPSSPRPGLLKLHLHFQFVFYHLGCQLNLCYERLTTLCPQDTYLSLYN